ncbi:unnamed protein product [Adineta steineri]|uniref:Uncharacterized protein n=1 Tax=Adineta steineri TaxID=433720 RepID=A0A813MR47_9BILA|nr:unnamed protein product [Adineta steineri]CAF0847330.1 unnamed protein product [Adineta steineri]
MNSTEPEDELSQDESASIHLYTMEWKVHDNSLYAMLNRTLRLADRRKLQPWFRYLKLFLTAFFRLPPSKYGTVWRGIPEDLKKVQVTTPKNNSVYSTKKLQCKGRACIKCGHCRDWYWCQDKHKKSYTKRNDATCTRRRYLAYPRVVYESEFYADRGSDYCHDHAGEADSKLCQCDDNQS